MPNEPKDMMAAVAQSMRERTGRSVDEWVAAVEAADLDPLEQKSVREWLKSEHGIPQNSQWTIADAAARKAGWLPPSVDESTDALYAGKKAILRPLHDRIAALALALGDDVEAQQRGTYIPFVRKTQFLALGPGPRGALRVGLRFRDAPPAAPGLEPAKSFASATHWVHLAADAGDADVDALEPLLAAAYAQNG